MNLSVWWCYVDVRQRGGALTVEFVPCGFIIIITLSVRYFELSLEKQVTRMNNNQKDLISWQSKKFNQPPSGSINLK
jgi:hypothetical protein